MVAVRMMQVAADDVISVVAMRYGGVTAVAGVGVTSGLFGGAVSGRAGVGICGADGNDVFVHMRTVGVMQMTSIKIVSVTVMRDGEMTTARAVRMLVGFGVLGVCGATASDERERNEQE